MDEDAVLGQLEELARGLGVDIRYESIIIDEETINAVGGLCILRGEHLLIINSNATVSEKIKAFTKALRHFDLNQIYVPPAIRALLETTTPCKLMATPKLMK